MLENKKVNILFLAPGPEYRPDLPNFKDRFEMLSEHFGGEIYSWSCDKKYFEYKIGSFVYRGLIDNSKGLFKRWKLARHIISSALKYNEQNKVEVVICYDPMFMGVVGSILKILLKCKLIVEINGQNYYGAVNDFYGESLKTSIKVLVFKITCRISFLFCDAIKVLSNEVKENLPKSVKKKKIFIFHDFVPTHLFDSSTDKSNSENVILFVGFPFYLKGVDILIKAFGKVSKQYPSFRLKLIGHKLEDDSLKYFREINDNIIFSKGIFYDQIIKEFEKCYCFVLPSRTEGMGRVLVEAMACSKPVLGANVGGIPNVIENGRNGFLFDHENVDMLAEKLDKLMSAPELARRMGEEGKRIVEERFSSCKYCEHFRNMVDAIYG